MIWVWCPWTSTYWKKKLFSGPWKAESLFQTIQVPHNDLWEHIKHSVFKSPYQSSICIEGMLTVGTDPPGRPILFRLSLWSLALSENACTLLTGARQKASEEQCPKVSMDTCSKTASTWKLEIENTQTPHLFICLGFLLPSWYEALLQGGLYVHSID